LHCISFYCWLHLPYYMHVVIHNDKAVNDYPLVPHEKIQAAGDDIFVFIWLKKWLPFQIGSGKELRILRDKGRHGLKLREVVLISVVGDAGTH
jgi:hypothetical protein